MEGLFNPSSGIIYISICQKWVSHPPFSAGATVCVRVVPSRSPPLRHCPVAIIEDLVAGVDS